MAPAPSPAPQHSGTIPAPPGSVSRRTLAWAVHAFTLSGAVWACLAALAILDGRYVHMWMWLGIALIVDGVDGTLARKADVLRHAPMFDGRTLDNIVDYLTWSFLPAVFMLKVLPLGSPPVALVLFVLVCASSLFCYCNLSLKTDDYYFMGFPAAWNIAAMYMWLLGTSAAVNITATIILAALTVSPLTFVHPFRVRQAMPVNIAAALTWLATTAALVSHYPERPLLAWVLWWLATAWLGGLSAVRTAIEIRGRRGAELLQTGPVPDSAGRNPMC